MKHTIATAVFVSAVCSFATSIPRASMRQISASPLERGETAYVERTSPAVERAKDTTIGNRTKRTRTSAANADGLYAEVYVGGESGPLRVMDSSAMRGYKLRTLEPSEYSVAAGPLFVHDVATGTYTMTQSGATNSIIVTAKDGVSIEQVEIITEFTGEGLIPGEFTCNESTYGGSVYRWECAWVRAASMVVKKIVVKAMDKGEIKWLNDTVDTVFEIHDVLGYYNLSDLRRWVRDLYNGNRGEDWSKYRAVKPVRMDGQAVRFTDDNRYTLSLSSGSNLVLQAAMHDAMEVKVRDGEDIAYSVFRITAIRNAGKSNTPMELDFTCDIANFNAANIGVSVCDTLDEGVWLGLAASDFSVSGVSTSGGNTTGTVTIPSAYKGNTRFYRLLYGNATSDVVDIVLHGRVVVKDIFVIKGIDGKFYRMDINGGAITATEVSL